MSFTITTREANAGAKSGTVYELGDDTCRIEVWPFMGFNCLRWQIRDANGSWGDLLYKAPDWETNPVPTRSGHPVLFPFPNRLAGGRFTFAGQEYQLPLNEATGKHAIHGFTPRNPWRVFATSANSITGEFHLSRDLPSATWPADFILQLTYRLSANTLEVLATVENPDSRPLPWGLGYHPYFCLPTASDLSVDDMMLISSANAMWETDAAIPTGRLLPLPPELDFGTFRLLGSVQLDHLFRVVSRSAAWLGYPTQLGKLQVKVSPAFRELLLFTPPHRKAVAIEPYTCATDAANLTTRGIDAGWQTLAAGERTSSAVSYHWWPED